MEPKFKVGDVVRVTAKSFIQYYGTGHSALVTEVKKESNGYFYRLEITCIHSELNAYAKKVAKNNGHVGDFYVFTANRKAERFIEEITN